MEENGDAERSNKRKQKRPLKVERGKGKTATQSTKVKDDKQEIPEVLEDIPQFLCTFCPKTFSINSLNGLDKHISEFHKSEIFCGKCKDVFKNNNHKAKHETSCSNDQPFYKKMEFIECVFCKHLYRRDKLKKHIDLEHNDNEGVPRKVSKASKSDNNSTATSILDILTNGNKVSLTQASLTLKEKILNFNKKLNSFNDIKPQVSKDCSNTVKKEVIDEDNDKGGLVSSPPNDCTITVKKEVVEESPSNETSVLGSNAPLSKINILGLKHKLQISLKSEND